MLIQHSLLAAICMVSVTAVTLLIAWSVSVGHIYPWVGKVADFTDGVAAVVFSVYLLFKFLDEIVFGHRLSGVAEYWLDRIFAALGQGRHLVLVGVIA